MQFIAIILFLLWCFPAYALTVEQHAADTSNPHSARMKVTGKLNIGTDAEYAASHSLKVVGGATIDTLDLGGGTLNFGSASSVNGSLSIGTTTAGNNRLNVIGTVSATTFVGDGTFLTGIGVGSGTGNWTDTGSSTQTYYPDTVTRKVAVGTTTVPTGNQFAVGGNSYVSGTITASGYDGIASGLDDISNLRNRIAVFTSPANGQRLQFDAGLNIVNGTDTGVVAGSTKITVTGTNTIDVDVDKLGTGSPTAYKFLCGDETWKNAIGEVANVGTGSGIYKTAVNNFTAQLKGLLAGQNMSISASTDDITINSIGTTSQWVNGGDTLYPGTLTVNVGIGTTTGGLFKFIVIGDAAVVGNMIIPGTLTTNMIIANAPPAADDDDIVNGGQLAQVKSDMLVEWFDHQLTTTQVHGVGTSTIASIVNVQTYAVGHPGSVNNDSFCGSTTAFSFSADSIVLRDAVNNLVCINNPANGTNTITLAGPIANGRATATAFTADTWIYFYWIWNGATLATLSSESYKTQGGDAVTLPTGYTHWCLAAIVRSNSSALDFGYMRGNTFYHDRRQTVVENQTNTTESTISMASFVPPQALCWGATLDIGINNNVPVIKTAYYKIRLITGQDYHRQTIQTNEASTANWESHLITIPNINQSIITIWTDTGGNTVSGNLYLLSYSIPNGGI